MPAAVSAPKPTLSEHAYRLLHSDTLCGTFAPGQRLKPQPLQDHYGMAISSVREALMLLGRDGLVSNDAQRGFSVTLIARENLFDIVSARQHLESMRLRDSIAEGDAQWGANIAAYDKLSHTPPVAEDDVGRGWEAAHRRFHHALLAAARSRWLMRAGEHRVSLTERYRRLRLLRTLPTRALAQGIADEHEELMQAALVRDAERACTARLVAPLLPED